MLFERNMMELSSLASKLPSDACKHPEESNVTMESNVTTQNNVTSPSPDASNEHHHHHHHHHEKHEKHHGKKKVGELVL